MNIHYGGKFFLFGNSRLPAVWMMRLLLTVSFLSLSNRGQTAPSGPQPRVIMLGLSDTTQNDADLYRAVRAQMSAVPLILDRIELDAAQSEAVDPLGRAAKAAAEHHAAMVFWIEDKETCTMFFYIPNVEGGRINSRVLNVELTGRTSRFEVIAIAAASMIEGLLVTHSLKHVPAAAQPMPISPSPPIPQAPKRKWIEIFAAYAGSYFAADQVTHGIRLGLGVLPIHRLVIAASFIQNVPLTMETEDFQLTIHSRMVEVSAAGRVLIASAEIRLGLSWSIDLRSSSTASLSPQLDAQPDGFRGLNALIPFVSATWFFTERMGLFGNLGASVALNETVYKVEGLEGREVAVSPFLAKLTYQCGLLVQL